ncbi:MAG: hypothetical protein VW684_15445, partial [Betaproteobacteria bacterium]
MINVLRKSILSFITAIAVVLFSLTACAKDSRVNYLTEINGMQPPGKLMRLQDTSVMLDTINSEGKRLLIEKGTRKAGTRVGIHIHKYGGHTCVISGTITDFIQGVEPKQFSAGEC